MITENKTTDSSNDSIVNTLEAPECGHSENDIANTNSSSEKPSSDGPNSAVLDANYIESKIKSLLNQADEKCDANCSDPANVSNQAEKETHISVVFTTEDSCNAVDNKISTDSDSSSGSKLAPEELSFNGKIGDLNAKNDSLNSSKEALHKSFELLTKSGTLPHYSSEKSPDLFDDDERKEEENITDEQSQPDYADADEKEILGPANGRMDHVDRIERTILERLQLSLSGVLPPPSVTYSHIDINRMLALYEQNKSCYVYDASEATLESILPLSCGKPTHTTDQLATVQWPDLLKLRAHGVCYNRSTVTEKIELLGLRYIDRYIGSETGSTFNVPRSPSSTKKRNLRFRVLNQSPGSRLSHLARRRAVFSSANLLNGPKETSLADPTQSAATLRVTNRQILLDPKKSSNRRKNKGRTPKRRTPGRRKTPRRKTPGSSVKKLSLSLSGTQPVLQSSRESSKRALFQSPPNEQKAHHKPSSSGIITAAANSKVQKSKRALFSPPKRVLRNSSSQSVSVDKCNSVSNTDTAPGAKLLNGNELMGPNSSTSGKRKRDIDPDEHDEVPKHSGKLPRKDDDDNEQDLTPRSLKLARSQSFCVGAQSSSTRRVSETGFCGKSLFRANSDVMFPNSVSRPVTMLTENHKKKLLWAVSQALQNKQISVKHENFKQYASNLARVVKRLFLEFNDQAVASTSEKLLRLANNNVFEVIQGRNVDDIYLREKTRILNAQNCAKPQGYIAPEDFEQHKLLLKRSVSTTALLSESSMDSSFGASSTQPMLLSQSSIFSQSSEYLNQLSQISSNCTEQPTTALADKTVLRENIDSEQRQKSAHKQISFSGRDQKNLSPYADNKANLQAKAKLLVGGVVSTSILKAKRQISFE